MQAGGQAIAVDVEFQPTDTLSPVPVKVRPANSKRHLRSSGMNGPVGVARPDGELLISHIGGAVFGRDLCWQVADRRQAKCAHRAKIARHQIDL